MNQLATELKLLTIATQATKADRPNSATVVAALLEVEKRTKQQRLTYPQSDLLGQWQLCFATGTRKVRRGGIVLGKGFYLPKFVQAQIGLHLDPAASEHSVKISNQIKLGTACLRITGPAKYLGKKNLLAFDFTQMQIQLFGRTLYQGNFRGGPAEAAVFEQKSIAKLPFFSFFLVTETVIAARGRGGGLAIWVKSNLPQETDN